MRRSIDNLGTAEISFQVKRGIAIIVGLCVFLGTLAIPASRLRNAQARLELGVIAEHRLPEMRATNRTYEQLGGLETLEQIGRLTQGELPKNLSRTDIHGAITLLAKSVNLSLEVLSVGHCAVLDLPQTDDAVAGFVITLVGLGGPQGLVDLVNLMGDLGYPVVVHEMGISRQNTSDQNFRVQATLELYQSVPIIEISDSQQDSQEPLQ